MNNWLQSFKNFIFWQGQPIFPEPTPPPDKDIPIDEYEKDEDEDYECEGGCHR